MPPSSIHMDHIRATQQAMRAESAGTPTPQKAADDEGMSFWDVLDVVNPLQHIPIVNKIYQAVTGDTIKTPAKLAGSALFFGPIGLAAAAADAVVEKETGKDVMDNITGWLGIGGEGEAESTPASPATDDPLTVTAPRPQKAASAPEQPQKAASLPVQELNGGQAAALERLMAASQGGASAEAGSATHMAKAVGGIGNAQQLKDLQTMPGASAAAMAASGLGASAAVASLPAPGSGAGNDVIAALAQQQEQQKAQPTGSSAGAHKNGQAQGMTLADYRANAFQRGSMGVKPLVPSSAVQLAQQQSGMPGTRAIVTIPASPQAKTAGTENGDPAITAQPATAATTTSVASTTQPVMAADQPGTPPSKERIAELMLMGITKYQQQQANAATAASANAANSNGGTAARKAGNE
jgi:hypothetical protein